MIVKIHRSGGSFRSAAEYCLGDKTPERKEGEERERKPYQEGDPSWSQRIRSDRVAWTQTLNLSTDDPYKASRMMAATVGYARRPTRAQVKAGGRELAKPVCHYSLSWKEGERPSRPDMIAAVEASMKVLQIKDHQALVVAHRDSDHSHVHVIANRVSWEDGRAAKLSQSRLHLSRWAEGYERSRGEIQCARRVEHNRIRDTGEAVYDRESKKANHWHRNHRQRSFGRSRYPEGTKEHAGEQRLTDQCQASIRERGESIDSRHKQQWRELYQRQARERKQSDTTKRDLLGRMSQGLDPKSLSHELERRHTKERAELGRKQSSTVKQLRNLYISEYVHGLTRLSDSFPDRMKTEKMVAGAKQSLRAALQHEVSGSRQSGGGVPVKIKGLDDEEEEHERSRGR